MLIHPPHDLSGSLQDYKIVQEEEQEKGEQLLSTSFMANQKISSQHEGSDFIKGSQTKQQMPLPQYDSGNMIYSDNSHDFHPNPDHSQDYHHHKYETPPQEHKFFSGSSRPRTQRSNTRYQSNEASFE